MSKIEPEIHLPPPLRSRPHVVQASQSGTPMRNFSEEDSNKEACKTISNESGDMSHRLFDGHVPDCDVSKPTCLAIPERLERANILQQNPFHLK